MLKVDELLLDIAKLSEHETIKKIYLTRKSYDFLFEEIASRVAYKNEQYFTELTLCGIEIFPEDEQDAKN